MAELKNKKKMEISSAQQSYDTIIKRNQITKSWQNIKQQNDQTSLALLMERSYLYNDENTSAGKAVDQ